MKIPPNILMQAEELYGVTEKRLREMLRLSTRITHPQGNRRYEGFLFLVQGDELGRFGKLPPESPDARCKTCNDLKRVPTFDECSRCHGNGAGCSQCDKGLVPSSIPCPDC